jgi:hypothetical protein
MGFIKGGQGSAYFFFGKNLIVKRKIGMVKLANKREKESILSLTMLTKFFVFLFKRINR